MISPQSSLNLFLLVNHHILMSPEYSRAAQVIHRLPCEAVRLQKGLSLRCSTAPPREPRDRISFSAPPPLPAQPQKLPSCLSPPTILDVTTGRLLSWKEGGTFAEYDSIASLLLLVLLSVCLACPDADRSQNGSSEAHRQGDGTSDG